MNLVDVKKQLALNTAQCGHPAQACGRKWPGKAGRWRISWRWRGGGDDGARLAELLRVLAWTRHQRR